MTMALMLTLAMLLACVREATAGAATVSCADVRTPSSVVPLGSSATASCLINDDCPLTKGRNFSVGWYLNNNLIPSSPTHNQDDGMFEIRVPDFNESRADLSCCVRLDFVCLIVGGVQIMGGSPPVAPQNLSCLLNLTEACTLVCGWDPGQNAQNIPTKYTLHTEIRHTSDKFIYELPAGVHIYKIPRKDISLFSKMQIFLKAENSLGEATSAPLVLEVMETAKLDPPEILRVYTDLKRYGCLKHSWGLLKSLMWVSMTLDMEMRLRPLNSNLMVREQVYLKRGRPVKPVEICGLLSGTQYQTQMRVRYRQSPWSEWSRAAVGATLERAPSGRLDTWLKAVGHRSNRLHIELFWKSSKQFQANGMNLSYAISLPRAPHRRLCVTRKSYCTFGLPKNIRWIYLTAMNSAGKSNPIKVKVHEQTAQDPVSNLSVSAQNDTDLLVNWTGPNSSSVTGYVLEWTSLCKTDLAFLSFNLLDKNHSSSLLSALEQFKPYRISVYPIYRNGIGLPQTVEAYTKQKAPSVVPELRFREIRHSYATASWDDIPLMQRNGIIQSYKVFYWDEQGSTKEAKVTERYAVLKELKPFSVYKAVLMVSTNGGSINGSIVTLKTESIDALGAVLILIPACVGVTLFALIIMFTCFSKQERLKMCLWPIIPDPANSSVKKWTITNSLQDIPSKEVKHPALVYLSHVSLLGSPEDGQKKADGFVMEDQWQCAREHAADPPRGRSADDSAKRPSSYEPGEHSDSIPYATVVFAGPYRSQPSCAPAYLRSESTQPLLEAEEPASPPPYENMAISVTAPEQKSFGEFQGGVFGERISGPCWEDFPLLNSLDLKHSQSET